jgi:hypothetical protein
MRLGNRLQQVGCCGDVADLPAGEREGLAGGADAHGALAHALDRHQRQMPAAVEQEVLVDLVADRIDAVFQAEPGNRLKLLHREHLAGRVHRVVDQDRLRVFRKGVLERAQVQPPVRRGDAEADGNSPGPLYQRQIAVIERLDEDHLVARLQQSQEGVGQGLGRTRGHHDLRLPVDVEPVEALVGGGDGLTQFGQSQHRRILVRPLHQRIGGHATNVLRPVHIGKALPQIDGAARDGKSRHGFENRGGKAGEHRIGRLHAVLHPCIAALPPDRPPVCAGL